MLLYINSSFFSCARFVLVNIFQFSASTWLQRAMKLTWTRTIRKIYARRLKKSVISSVARTAKSNTWILRIASAAVALILAGRRSVLKVLDVPLRWSPRKTARSTTAYVNQVSIDINCTKIFCTFKILVRYSSVQLSFRKIRYVQ